MIRKMKIKFIALAMAASAVLLTVIITGMNLINYASVVNEADTVLTMLSQGKGAFAGPGKKNDGQLPRLSPETPYESRYFSVTLDADGEIIGTETSRIVTVDRTMAAEYAEEVLESGRQSGFADNFRYCRLAESDGSRIIFLDCGRKLDSFHNFLAASIGMALAGYVLMSVVIIIFAGKIIRPIAESYEKQKRFITDAGHEMRTPLTVISANADLLEMELGEQECLSDIRQQTDRLKSLTNDLVMLARMEESGESTAMIDFPASEIVLEAAHSFNAVALRQNIDFICNVQPLLTLKGDAKAIQKLVSVLLDNAMKYSPSGKTVELEMVKQNKSVRLSVTNSVATEIDTESLCHVFDRFYRADESRNSETGGHGIGLSVAKAIVTAHGGKIQASSPDSHSFRITAVFPA